MSEKECPSCGRTIDIQEFMRRTGQPYFVERDGRAWPSHPLLPRVEEEICNTCFVIYAISGDDWG